MAFVFSNFGSFTVWAIVIVVGLWLFLSTVRIIEQYQRGVVLTLGRYTSTRQPGLNFLVPVLQTMRRADVRVTVMVVEPQDVITRDNVSVKVSAVTYYRVVDAKQALIDVQNYRDAIDQLAQVTLRSTIGKHPLDELLAQQDKLNETLAAALESRTQQWGVQVDHVEIRSVDLDPTMIRAMAQQAEAERGRRARVIVAEGEFEAAAKLAQAAEVLGRHPAALTLRTLATLKEIGSEQNTTIVFPVSQEMLLPATAALAAALRPKD